MSPLTVGCRSRNPAKRQKSVRVAKTLIDPAVAAPCRLRQRLKPVGTQPAKRRRFCRANGQSVYREDQRRLKRPQT